MSGHSKWATIKRSKGKTDAARGRLFSRLIREITIAARMGGGDINGNPRLRSAVASAKSNNMPGKNIENAIAKGTGQLEGITYEEMVCEGYAPGGVAVLVDCTTDNHNRAVAEVRHAFTKAGGNLGAANSVSWMFKLKGTISVAKADAEEDSLMELALDAGAEDMSSEEDAYEITTTPQALDTVREAIEKAGIKIESSEMAKVADNLVKVEGENAHKVLRLMEALDELDDTQKVVSNADFRDEDIASFGEGK